MRKPHKKKTTKAKSPNRFLKSVQKEAAHKREEDRRRLWREEGTERDSAAKDLYVMRTEADLGEAKSREGHPSKCGEAP